MPQTPTHWLVTRQLARHAFPGDRAAQAAAQLGAVVPDLYYWARGAALAARHRRWDPAYIDVGRETRWPDKALHSLLPPTALAAAAAFRRNRVLAAFAAAWAGHVAADIPVHDGSSRPPAWPLWSWRFRSPGAAGPGSRPGWPTRPSCCAPGRGTRCWSARYSSPRRPPPGSCSTWPEPTGPRCPR